MAKKYHANMPTSVVQTSYPKKGSAIKEGSYVDTQPGLDSEFNKVLSKVRKKSRK